MLMMILISYYYYIIINDYSPSAGIHFRNKKLGDSEKFQLKFKKFNRNLKTSIEKFCCTV